MATLSPTPKLYVIIKLSNTHFPSRLVGYTTGKISLAKNITRTKLKEPMRVEIDTA